MKVELTACFERIEDDNRKFGATIRVCSRSQIAAS
jgi:hypothetical protein